MTEIVTIGWLTMDDIVLTDHSCRPGVLGGGALYSAIGAQIWGPRVGIHSVAGRPTADAVREAIRRRDLDAEGIGVIDGNGLQLWLLHESATDKQQVPKLGATTAQEMDEARGPLPSAYCGAHGFHVAPQTPAGSLEALRRLRGLPGSPAVTLDVLSDEFIDRRLYQDLGFLRGVTAFLPSEAEVARIWDPRDLHQWMCGQAATQGCHIGVKLGSQGSVVCDGVAGTLHHIPSVPARVVDTTGAGDAYCGGFLAGLIAGRSIPDCAAMGTVSASYVVEACGALETGRPDLGECHARLERVRSGIRLIAG